MASTPDTRSQHRLPGVLGGVAAFLLLASLFFPYWQAKVFAPQYPQGLTATMYAYRVGGDVFEINSLNHYIGMSKLENLARLERFLGIPAVIGMAFLCWRAAREKRSLWRWGTAVLVTTYPAAFIGDMMFWMRYASTHLDPTAPLKLKPFSIPVFGAGKIAQFQSEVGPTTGFYMALASIALLWATLWLSRKSVSPAAAPTVP